MSRWRKRLFLVTALIAAEPADYFHLPRERTVTLGSEIEFWRLPPNQHVDERDGEGELADPEGGAQVLGAEQLGEADADAEGDEHDGELGGHGPGL